MEVDEVLSQFGSMQTHDQVRTFIDGSLIVMVEIATFGECFVTYDSNSHIFYAGHFFKYINFHILINIMSRYDKITFHVFFSINDLYRKT